VPTWATVAEKEKVLLAESYEIGLVLGLRLAGHDPTVPLIISAEYEIVQPDTSRLLALLTVTVLC
jgi:hypothetical protein